MNWFLIALIGPILYALTNHIDKYILEKYFKGGEEGALVLFSSLFSIFFLPVVYFFNQDVFSMGLLRAIILVVTSSLSVIPLILYLKALDNDEPSIVVPFYQTIPVFGFILGYFLLGEVLGVKEVLASILILVGTTIISLDFNGGGFKLRTRTALFMMLSSFIFAVIGVVFKIVAVDEGFWPSAFWALIGDIAVGGLIFFGVKSYREQFLEAFHTNSASILSINSLNEILFILADGVSAYATLLAPIALVMVVNGFQPAFVFIVGIILTLFFPKLGRESITAYDLAQKILAIGLIAEGSILLNVNI